MCALVVHFAPSSLSCTAAATGVLSFHLSIFGNHPNLRAEVRCEHAAERITMFAPTRRSRGTFRLFLVLAGSFLSVGLAVSAPPQQQLPSPVSAIPELKARAESGETAARLQLRQFLISANPASPDYDLALSWLRSSASQNLPESQLLLGYLYEQGEGVPSDFTKAAENYRAAALQGNPAAENNLCFLYHRGKGVPQDQALAFQWCRAAARHGNAAAQQNLGALYFLGLGTPVDFGKAAEWFRAAADQGLAAGQSNLAYAYLKGNGVPQDYSQAAHWARLAADQGHPRASALLAYLYENGEGLPLDYVSAYAWYSRAVAAGDNSNADRLKSLSHLMTRKQLNQANSLVTTQSHPSQPGTATANSAVLPDFLNP